MAAQFNRLHQIMIVFVSALALVCIVLMVLLFRTNTQYELTSIGTIMSNNRDESTCNRINWMDDFKLFKSIVQYDKLTKLYLLNSDDISELLVNNNSFKYNAIINDKPIIHSSQLNLFSLLSDGGLLIERISDESQISSWCRFYELVNLNINSGFWNQRVFSRFKAGTYTPYYVGNIFCWKCGCVAQKEFIEKKTSLTNTMFESISRESIFYKLAIKTRTDKIRKHQYHRLYSKYFDNDFINYSNTGSMLEIGLGCNMNYGEHYGGSAYIWPQMFNNVNFIEYDNECLKKYKDELDKLNFTVWSGDQSDVKFLENIKNNIMPRGFDIIIDDASHFNVHIIISFTILWPSLNKNGIYFIEDHGESAYLRNYLDSQPITIFGNEKPGTAQYFIKTLLYNLFCDITTQSCYDLKFIECRQDICVLKKT